MDASKGKVGWGLTGAGKDRQAAPSAIWGAFAWLGGRKRSLGLMVYRGLESQPVRKRLTLDRIEKCRLFRSPGKSSRRLREVDLVLTLNSGPFLALPPSKPKCQKGPGFPLWSAK